MPRSSEITPGSTADIALQLVLSRMGLDCAIPSRATIEKSGLCEGLTLSEIAHRLTSDSSQSAARGFSSNPDIVSRAMSTSDFPALLANLAEKTLQAAYKTAAATWPIWTSKGLLNNFKESQISRISPPGLLEEVLESGEYKSLKFEDGKERAKIKTFGGMARFTRQAIINDDLDGLKDMARLLAITAATTVGRKVYGSLLSNAELNNGVALFDASRGNLLTGSTSALSRESLAAGVKTMRLFADESGIPLSVEPKYLLVPPSLEMTAHELCFSDSIPGQSNSNVVNLFKKIGITPIVEPLLESPIMPGSSSTAWYLMPSPDAWPVVRVFGLGTTEIVPYVESQTAWANDAAEYKVRIDVDSAAIGYFAIKSAGQ
jgi:hypothetical protein